MSYSPATTESVVFKVFDLSISAPFAETFAPLRLSIRGNQSDQRHQCAIPPNQYHLPRKFKIKFDRYYGISSIRGFRFINLCALRENLCAFAFKHQWISVVSASSVCHSPEQISPPPQIQNQIRPLLRNQQNSRFSIYQSLRPSRKPLRLCV